MSNQQPIVLVSSGDDGFAMPMAVALYSALSHIEPDILVQIYIMDGGLSQVNKRNIEKVVQRGQPGAELTWVSPDIALFSDFNLMNRFSLATYFRLMVPTLLPEKHDRAIYLDGDMVVEDNLRELWQAPLRGHLLGAVRDYGGPYAKSAYGLKHVYQELGLEAETPCFNAGLLLFDLNKCRRGQIGEQALSYLRDYHERVRLQDQEALNAVAADDWIELDVRWNSQVDALQNFEMWENTAFKEEMRSLARELMDNPYIYHFIGGRKPWEAGLVKPGRRRFMHYLKESRWFTPGEYRRWWVSWLWSSLAFALNDVLRKPTVVLDKLRERLR